MKSDAIWQAFTETGDPICYMLYRAVRSGTAQVRSGGQP